LPDAPSATAVSQTNGFANDLGKAAKTIGYDQLNILKAPFKKKNIKWDILVVGATGVLIANDESVIHQVPTSWHGTSIDLSNAALGATAATAGGIYFTGLFTDNEHAKQTGVLSAESTIDSAILFEAMKVIFARQRPSSSEGEGKFFSGNWSNGSFPSGHAALSWALASTVAHQYHSVWLDILLYGLATTVSTSRVTAREHFPADVFAGSVLGYGVGAYVTHKDTNKNVRPKKGVKHLSSHTVRQVLIGSP
jgi:membrane-associated phospholipid phosphatase